MAGYSGTPLVKKLGIKEDAAVLVIDAPEGFSAALGELPPGTALLSSVRAKGPFDVILCFLETPADLDARLEQLRPKMAPHCGLWFCWRKGRKGPGVLNENVVQKAALAAGLVDNKVCAVDETWSGLRVVIRVKDRTA